MATIQHVINTDAITSDIPPSEQAKIINGSNWSTATGSQASNYLIAAPAIVGVNQYQFHFDGLFLYFFIADNIPVRIKCD